MWRWVAAAAHPQEGLLWGSVPTTGSSGGASGRCMWRMPSLSHVFARHCTALHCARRLCHTAGARLKNILQSAGVNREACARLLQENPGVAVVENLEDMWLLSKLQRDRQAKEEAEKAKKLAVREGWGGAMQGQQLTRPAQPLPLLGPHAWASKQDLMRPCVPPVALLQ